jgi:hypothetical protein
LGASGRAKSGQIGPDAAFVADSCMIWGRDPAAIWHPAAGILFARRHKPLGATDDVSTAFTTPLLCLP